MTQNILRRMLPALSLFLIFSLSSCKSKKEADEIGTAAKDPLWSEFISEHTTGLISKESRIRIRFINDVVSEDKIGEVADSIVEIDPPVEGMVLFSNRREIVVVPEKQLTSGQGYKVKVHTDKLEGFPKKLDLYEFTVTVFNQEFEIDVIGLNTGAAGEEGLFLRGTLATADVEKADLIEKVLSAHHMGKPMDVEWQHNADGRNHQFTIPGIVRGEENGILHLSWDGSAIGVNSRGGRDLEVPAMGIFKVLKVQAVQEARQYVLIHFSDRLDPNQNIKGLINIGRQRYTSRTEGNTVKIYPRQAVQGELRVTVEPGIRNAEGSRLGERVTNTVFFISRKPQVRFVGKGVILPENEILSIPFEAVNVDSVQVTAFRVFANNIGQFLQNNKLEGKTELGRVGRFLWRKTIDLSSPVTDKWNRYSLDATELLRNNPGGLFRLILSINRGNSTYACSEEDNSKPVVKEEAFKNFEDLVVNETSSWDYAENYYGSKTWTDRRNPCKDAYYRYAEGVTSSRNLLASNIGILAKRGSTGNINIITTDLRTSAPMPGVKVDFINFQNQVIGSISTDNSGFGEIELAKIPFYLTASKGDQLGYLKMNAGSALPFSHFDVGGARVDEGIKGYIYGERGVWRPGDDIYLTFVLEDKDNVIPPKHPATMQLFNPQGQLAESITNNKPVGDFYAFKMKTAEDASTGNWKAKVLLGGSTFTKSLKIETVIPNRLKVELDFGMEALRKSDMPVIGKLFGQWLHGGTASGLKTDVSVRMSPVSTRFKRFGDFVFDDPARDFQGERQVLFEGKLDGSGKATFEKSLRPGDNAPGMLKAHFTTRVFEEGGAFSSSRMSLPYYPYDNYIGIKVPKGDQARGMLLTDTVHRVEIASVDSFDEPVSLGKIQVTLYKIGWKWWWDKSGESLAQYASATHRSKIQQNTISTRDGRGIWEFEIKYPAWGRYLVRACDLEGEHCTGKVIYVDWPGWAGRAQEEGGAGASVLSFFSDKTKYDVGEVARIELPEATKGRALVSIENGTGILEQRWIEFDGGKSEFEVPLTREMSPNVYVNVALIQPHSGRDNDRPIRLYGAIPIEVNDPETILKPVLKAPDEWEPESRAFVEVAEASGRAMTYTVAVVDEGLLGLTGFRTPDLHRHFYRREALGVMTWDLFDQVAGAYGGELERLLALGGDEDLAKDEEDGKERRRFPPVVRFLGPFKLKPGETAKHGFDLPQYVGAVRVMVVAGEQRAYGLAEKSVFVRESLMLLATLPRVLGPDEKLTVPVSTIVMDPEIKDVTLKMEADEYFEVVDGGPVSIEFPEPGEKLGFLKLKVGGQLGQGKILFRAEAGGHRAESDIYVDIRSPNPETVRQNRSVIEPGREWSEEIIPHGIEGTNTVSLEVSAMPPINLERRLAYLIRYPHGCIEQVTSAVFPQLYLPNLVKLDDERKNEIQNNVNSGIERLRQFQNADGGFSYWPGGSGAPSPWGTNYAGHFLVEAEKQGYHVPADMFSQWISHQKSVAQSWNAAEGKPALDQAYRLYTLALANRPELGAMNRLRESAGLKSVERWQLAAAYQLAGLPDPAHELVLNDRFQLVEYVRAGLTFGSKLRDRAIILNSLMTLGDITRARDYAEEISDELSTDRWLSTQSVAYALLAMSRFIGHEGAGVNFTFDQSIGGNAAQTVTSTTPIYATKLKAFPLSGDVVRVLNTSGRTLYGSIVVRGTPRAGEEMASSDGLSIGVKYKDMKGSRMDVTSLEQGTDFIAEVKIRNIADRDFRNLALSHIVPSGWELHNTRFDSDNTDENSEVDYQDIRDDRVYTYFGLKAGEEKTFVILLNASYLGSFYLPSVSVEAMYDATKGGRTKGWWIEVVKRADD